MVIGHGMEPDFHRFVYRLANIFGTSNVLAPGHACYLPRAAIARGMEIPMVDYENRPKRLISWGANHLISNTDESKCINLAKTLKADAKHTVIDPRRTKLAHGADLWLQLRPATDVTLGLGMMKVIMDEGLHDKESVEKYTTGFDKFAARLQEFLLERVENLT